MKTALRSCATLMTVVVLLVACTREPNPASGTPQLPIVVYAAYEDKNYLPELFTEFTRETGSIVIVRNGTVPGIVDDVIQERISPPADVLLTPAAVGVWRAAEAGQLRPNYSPLVAAKVAAWLRDPDNFWVALSYRDAVLVYDPDQFAAADLATYEALGEQRFRRQLCLSSSGLAINRSVLAMLAQKLGERGAELAVRGWVANLALPAFDTEENLLGALESGSCGVAILPSDVAILQPDSRLRVVTPSATYSAAEAIGITRHARNPDGAAQLIDWLLQPEIQKRHAAAMSTLPAINATERNSALSQAAAGDAEARLLAERARYR